MAVFNPLAVRNVRQFAARRAAGRTGGGAPVRSAPHMGTAPQPFGGPARPAATADDYINRNGGSLAPSYGPTGINDTYSRAPSAFDRLQASAARAQSGDAQGANMLEKADQAQGAGFLGAAQGLRDAVGTRDVLGRAGARQQAQPGVQPTQRDANGLDAAGKDVFGNTPKIDPFAKGPTGDIHNPVAGADPAGNDVFGNAAGGTDPETGEEFGGAGATSVGDGGGTEAVAEAHGGKLDGQLATVGEKGPEHKFNDDGTVEQFDSPTLLHHPSPGVVVPDPALRRFLNRYRRPAKDVSELRSADSVGSGSGSGGNPPALARGGFVGNDGSSPLAQAINRETGISDAYAANAAAQPDSHPAFQPVDPYLQARTNEAIHSEQGNADPNAMHAAVSHGHPMDATEGGNAGDVPASAFDKGGMMGLRSFMNRRKKVPAFDQGGGTADPEDDGNPSPNYTPPSGQNTIPGRGFLPPNGWEPVDQWQPSDYGTEAAPGNETPEELTANENEWGPAPRFITGEHALPAMPTGRHPHSWELPENSPAAMFNAGREAVVNHKILNGVDPGDPDAAYLPRDANGIRRGINEMPSAPPGAYGGSAGLGHGEQQIDGLPANEWFQNIANHFGAEGGKNAFAAPEPGYHGNRTLWDDPGWTKGLPTAKAPGQQPRAGPENLSQQDLEGIRRLARRRR